MTEARRVDVFFYGLFMDEALLREKGADPRNARIACVEDHALTIGNRATLVRRAGSTAHGVVMALTHAEIDALYADSSLGAYRPEAVAARLVGGRVVPALCFNLPAAPAAGERNPQYAERLRDLARRLGLPDTYVASIGRETDDPAS